MSPNMLGIEKALEGVGGSFINKYRLMRDRLLNVEYEHWAAGFPAGVGAPEQAASAAQRVRIGASGSAGRQARCGGMAR